MRRLLLLSLCLVSVLLTPLLWSEGQQVSLPNVSHPLLAGLTDWWRGVPGLTGGTMLANLLRWNPATLTNMGFSTTTGWSPSTRPGGFMQLNFDGTDDYARTASTADIVGETSPFTLCVWLNPTTSASGTQMVLATGDGSDPFIGIQVRWSDGGSRPRFRVGDAAGYSQDIVADNQPPAGVWQHWCAVRTGEGQVSGMSFVVNGEVMSSTAGNNYTLTTTFPVTPWTFGAFCCAAPSSYFQGAIDDIRIWQRALTPMEIHALYRQGLQGDSELLQALPSLVAVPLDVSLFPRKPHVY